MAGVLHVPGDHPTIWQAVDAAAAGDSVLIAAGTWTDRATRLVPLGGSIFSITSCGFLKAGVTLIGESGAAATVVDGGVTGPGLVMTFILANQPAGEVVLQGLTITGAEYNAVDAHACDKLTIRSCRIVNNTLVPSGSAIDAALCKELRVFDSEISFNVRDLGQVSGIHAPENDLVEVRRCRFEGNYGRALGAGDTTPPTTVIVTDCEFVGNRALDGAAVQVGGGPGSATVERNLFLRNAAENGSQAYGGALSVDALGATIRFNTFAFDSSSGVGGGVFIGSGPVTLSDNTFYGCHVSPGYFGCAVTVGSATVSVQRNVFSFSTGGSALMNANATLSGGCNVIYGNAGGDFYGWVPFATDIFLDPLFCDPDNLDFTIHANSPCAPGNTPGCAQVGAHGVGCGQVSVEAASWAKIKSLYR
jgi:hypothetical protein